MYVVKTTSVAACGNKLSELALREGKTAVVTGGARGLGACMCQMFAKEFARKGAAVRLNCIAPGYTMTDIAPEAAGQVFRYGHAGPFGSA